MAGLDASRQPWHAFDAAWYRCAYPIVDELIERKLYGRPEDMYAMRGVALGHAPNPFFNERWYLTKYPSVRDEVAAGLFASGFDHFCRHGHTELTPHWLFDPAFYRGQYQQAHGRPFDPAVDGDPYGNFLRIGQFNGLSGHWLFTSAVYSALAQHDVGIRIMRDGPFTTFLLHIGARVDEPVVSNLFDPHWYLARYPSVGREVREGRWECALHHYIANTEPTRFDPSPRFSDLDYLKRYPAVAAAIEARGFRNGFDHFLRHGRAEGRYFTPVVAKLSTAPVTTTFPLRTRVFDTVTLLPCQVDPRSPTGHSFGVLDRHGGALWEFGNGRMAMRSANVTPSRAPGTYIYGGMLTNHFGHVLADGLAALWFIRQNPELPVLWHWFEHPLPHDQWPTWLDQIWQILGLRGGHGGSSDSAGLRTRRRQRAT